MNELAFPATRAQHARLDLVERLGEDRLEDDVADPAHGFVGGPRIQLFRAAAPLLDDPVEAANRDSVVREVEQLDVRRTRFLVPHPRIEGYERAEGTAPPRRL